MVERLQKILYARGVASRRQAEQMILDGRVSCNGQVCSLGASADPDVDCITVDGKQLPSAEKNLYIMLHKPKGYVTTLSDEKGRNDVSMLVSDCGARVYPVGRLDMDSEGLLIMTNDGAFANHLMHPRHEVKKQYHVTVKGFSQEKLERVKKPVILDGYRIKPPEVQLVSCTDDMAQLIITIHEGRNRQVRRMCAIADMKVKRLVRIAEGSVLLDSLECGKWRYLTDEEIRLLKG